MGLQRQLGRAANRLLNPYGYSLQKTGSDFDSRVENRAALDRMFRELADAAEHWLGAQTLFEHRPFPAKEGVAEFYEAYIASPYRQPYGGSRFNNLVWLYLIARSYRPTIIVDSGTYQGASAWALSQGAPAGTPLYSFDIDLSQLKGKVDATYMECDWLGHDFTEDRSRGLCYFDDHVDQARRLIEARDKGFPLAIFDDDFPVTSFAQMAHDGRALPKVEMVLDEQLRGEATLRWSSGGRLHSWDVDAAYLDRARQTIAATDRLPNTSLVTGIHQTPYRVVKLAV